MRWVFSQKTGRSKDLGAAHFHSREEGQVHCQEDVQGIEGQRVWLLPLAEKQR